MRIVNSHRLITDFRPGDVIYWETLQVYYLVVPYPDWLPTYKSLAKSPVLWVIPLSNSANYLGYFAMPTNDLRLVSGRFETSS